MLSTIRTFDENAPNLYGIETFFSFEIPSKSTSLNQISSPFSLFVCLFLREFYRLFAIEKTTKTHDK